MLIGEEPLDLRLTLIDSAQCFRWTERGGRFGCAFERGPVWLWRTARGIEAEGDFDRAWLRRYLDLDRDYAAIAEQYAGYPAAREAMALLPGLRVLNQSPWEALISFILSANNNVERIRSLAAALCSRYGRAFDDLHGFPTPEQLNSAPEDELRGLRVGYRAPYLIGAARRVVDGFPLEDLRKMPYEDAHRLLVTLPGVGDKVADCVLLFGCGQTSAFPVDVWVARLMKRWFGIEEKNRAATQRRAREMFGENAGLLQQFLFHAARVGVINLKEA